MVEILEAHDKNFVERSDMAIFYYALNNINPKLATSTQSVKKINNILKENNANTKYKDITKWKAY